VSAKSPLAAWVLAKIGELYAIEAEIRGQPAEHRRRVRRERSRPIVEALHTWLQDHVGRVSAVSDLAKAIHYAIRYWQGLTVFLEDGRVEMDTNVVERAIRPNTLTRKNTLPLSNYNGAVHWTIAMTLIQTARSNGVDPMAYLADVLERVVSGQTKRNEMHTLLPWNWTASASATVTSQAA
jgi:transposase